MQYLDLFDFLLKVAFVVLILVSLLFGVVVPLYRGFSKQSRQRSIESPVGHRAVKSLNMFDEDEVEIPTAGESQGDHNREIVKMAREDPMRTTQLIRNWIREKK